MITKLADNLTNRIIADLMLKAPEPTKEYLEIQLRIDMSKNPHGDTHRNSFKRRTISQITADYKQEWVVAHYQAIKELSVI